MRKVRYHGRGMSQRRVVEGKSPGGDAVVERYLLMQIENRPAGC